MRVRLVKPVDADAFLARLHERKFDSRLLNLKEALLYLFVFHFQFHSFVFRQRRFSVQESHSIQNNRACNSHGCLGTEDAVSHRAERERRRLKEIALAFRPSALASDCGAHAGKRALFRLIEKPRAERFRRAPVVERNVRRRRAS